MRVHSPSGSLRANASEACGDTPRAKVSASCSQHGGKPVPDGYKAGATPGRRSLCRLIWGRASHLRKLGVSVMQILVGKNFSMSGRVMRLGSFTVLMTRCISLVPCSRRSSRCKSACVDFRTLRLAGLWMESGGCDVEYKKRPSYREAKAMDAEINVAISSASA